ncbi:hypothetical protein BofuT4_P131330.1 [Botrytis cinerea T4]|uniref:Uncharacterized protein n=1 Tax=Botryotinia fuckeliana (strain T4) TaxID=999810 RepID=G2YQQ5_BOTF4|nr:hypothetical protein BofuT4_P131330.1 [Botrytis cinerea T4]
MSHLQIVVVDPTLLQELNEFWCTTQYFPPCLSSIASLYWREMRASVLGGGECCTLRLVHAVWM